MKALEIWQQDITDREAGQALPRQQYYTALRDALHRELMQKGYCDLLEQLLLDIRSGEMTKIYVVDYAALMECHSMIVLGRSLRDAADFVPHLHLRGEKASWDVLEGAGSVLMPIRSDMTEKLKQLRAVSRQLVDARDDTVLPQADDAAQREIEQVHTLNKLLDERCKALQAERDELQARLRLLEEGVITEQVRYAIEARRLQEEEALRQSYEAQRYAASTAFREQYAQEQAEARSRLEEEARRLAALREDAAQDYAAVRAGMAADLHRLSALLESQRSAWETGLARSECRMLAASYVALHQTWAEGMARLLLEAQCTQTDAAILTGLTEMDHQLRDRVRQLETAMARLGLTVIRPAQGDVFNAAYHLPVEGSADSGGIRRCLVPGVMAAGAADALVKAEVEVN